MGSYLLQVGDADRERLDVLADIYDEGSKAFIRNSIASDVGTIVDAGCGHGQITCWLGETFPGAKVMGLDCSEDQLVVCEETRARKGLQNVSLVKRDLLNCETSPACADVLFARYLFLHIKDWDPLFSNLLAMCRTGGCILLEEPGFPFVCYPHHPALDRANELGEALTTRLGLRFDCIAPLWRYVNTLESVMIRNYSFSQPFFATVHKKSLLWRSFLQIKEPLIATKLASRDEVDEILAGLEFIANDPLHVVGSLRMIQLNLMKR